jgi:acetyl-CoA carboxylase biotin carboxyl carrier protein
MDMKQIKTLMREFNESGLSKLKLTKEDFSLELEKTFGAPAVAAAPAPQVQMPAPTPAPVVNEAVIEITGDMILSPMVGTFYASPSPDSPAFVKKGDTVKKGHTLAILEAMKIMNELEAEFDCKIVDILVSDGQPVEYDMPLFVVEKI